MYMTVMARESKLVVMGKTNTTSFTVCTTTICSKFMAQLGNSGIKIISKCPSGKYDLTQENTSLHLQFPLSMFQATADPLV